MGGLTADRVVTRLAAAGSTALVLAPRQATARGVVAGSVAVHGYTVSWLAARLTAVRTTAGLSTAAGSTAGALAAGGHTSRFSVSDLTASRGAAGLAAWAHKSCIHYRWAGSTWSYSTWSCHRQDGSKGSSRNGSWCQGGVWVLTQR